MNNYLQVCFEDFVKMRKYYELKDDNYDPKRTDKDITK